MSELKPIRRVVTGNDARGRSGVLFDGAAPNVNPRAVSPGAGMTDVWVFDRCPAIVSGERDDGNLPFNFEPPERGGHLRIVQSQGRPSGYDPAGDPSAVPVHEPRQRPGGTWDRGGQNAYSSPIHKSATVDYGIVLEGERVLLLDDGEHVMRPGDVVVQLGNWHGWTNPRGGSLMAFVMMGATFAAGGAGATAPRTWQAPTIADDVRPVRRLVTIDDEHGKSAAIQDGPCPDVHTDPARPGFSSTRIWVTDRTPARIHGIREAVNAPHTIQPPPGGSVCRIVTVPPDAAYRGRIDASDVLAFFRSMGSEAASTYSAKAPHPYMQKTATLDLCLVLEGEVTLVLDTDEVRLTAGDTVVQRATNHSWSNSSNRPAVVAISSHDARA
jgi:quercetin dioxygenase-like cupin family protein